MVTISAALALSGFFSFYCTSRKVKVPKHTRLASWLHEGDPMAGQAIGLALVLTSLVVLILEKGIGIGSLTFMIILMTAGSAMVLFHPLRIFRFSVVALLFGIALITEYFLS